ncbi:Hsp70 family protein [Saccharopolyspora erythraea]|uniref:Hsp70 family protein n=1 Tax=Saccharopolyspora erythraea TaxID=1836 RepID=UPI001BABCC0E|nr:Hsp70 family protein [Saccharopolyspora erythraea]QUH04014.1 Hsp70 family protein [Saccharopolyspora erythraea]
MARDNIDFGIDLGTTTSIIAAATADDATVVRNNRQAEHTPSAVYVSRSNKVLVGQPAKDRVEEDPDNACAEFKLQMGRRDAHKTFTASGRSMTPEELSAEVLKSLRGDVQHAMGESIGAAVITVPAAFELDQCDATRKAAELAGLGFAPLIQEPSAAAWAYSTHLKTDRGFWLVYDFGGGTFDAAIVKVSDGEFSTINHAGDNFLGGKLIDWGLVEGLLVPAVRDEFDLPDLDRGHRKSAGNIAKLKAAAEYAKIELSRAESSEISVRLNDADGTPAFDFEFELTRGHVERIALPLYQRSIALCRKAIAESGLAPGDIERVLLVGGTTIAPALRELLADPAEGLGIPLDHSLDPVTVVARGAAIFAGTQRMPARPERAEQALSEGRVVLKLQYPSAGSDTEPLVGGLPPRTTQQQDWTGATIEFVHPDGTPPWRSGRIPLTPEGTFATRLRADEQTVNTYDIELRDAQGTLVTTDPERISYRHTSKMGTAPTLSHSIGVALDNNEVLWLVRKGAELPAKARAILYSTVTVRRNERTGLIRVPLVEGERSKGDRNMLIGQLDLVPTQVGRDVPAGSEVEVALQIDTSFTPRADAYVPLLDEDFQIQVELGRAGSGTDLPGAAEDLADRFDELAERLEKLRFSDVDASEAIGLVDRFRADDVLADVQRLADAAGVDPDAASTCENRLRDAQTALDDIEAALVFPELAAEGRSMVEGARGLIDQSGAARHRTALHNAERAMEAAIASGDRTVLQRQIEVMRDIVREVLRDSGQLAAVIFVGREGNLADNPDPRVQELLQQGRRALETGDVALLTSVNAQLAKAAPDTAGDAGAAGGLGSTVRAGDQ